MVRFVTLVGLVLLGGILCTSSITSPSVDTPASPCDDSNDRTISCVIEDMTTELFDRLDEGLDQLTAWIDKSKHYLQQQYHNSVDKLRQMSQLIEQINILTRHESVNGSTVRKVREVKNEQEPLSESSMKMALETSTEKEVIISSLLDLIAQYFSSLIAKALWHWVGELPDGD